MHRSAAFSRFLDDPDRQARLFAAGQNMRKAWAATPEAERLATVLQQLSDLPPADVASFVDLLRPLTADACWIRQLVDKWVTAMQQDMFAGLPWQSQQSASIQGLTLLQHGRASCSLLVVDGDALLTMTGDQVVFDHGMTLLWLLSGRLTGRSFSRAAGSTVITEGPAIRLEAGQMVATNCQQQQLTMTRADGDCVMLRVSVASGPPGTRVCEFSTQTGQLTRHGCGDGGTSRMLALLDIAAGAEFAELLPILRDLSDHADPALRWQAMRMWIVGDPQSALSRLTAMAACDGDADVRNAAHAALSIVRGALMQPAPRALVGAG